MVQNCVQKINGTFGAAKPVTKPLETELVKFGLIYMLFALQRACLKRRHVYVAVWPSGRSAEIIVNSVPNSILPYVIDKGQNESYLVLAKFS